MDYLIKYVSKRIVHNYCNIRIRRYPLIIIANGSDLNTYLLLHKCIFIDKWGLNFGFIFGMGLNINYVFRYSLATYITISWGAIPKMLATNILAPSKKPYFFFTFCTFSRYKIMLWPEKDRQTLIFVVVAYWDVNRCSAPI